MPFEAVETNPDVPLRSPERAPMVRFDAFAFVAKSDVFVALVIVAFVPRSEAIVPFVAVRIDAKKFVELADVVVPRVAVKSVKTAVAALSIDENQPVVEVALVIVALFAVKPFVEKEVVAVVEAPSVEMMFVDGFQLKRVSVPPPPPPVHVPN